MSRQYRVKRGSSRTSHMNSLYERGINPSFTYGPKDPSKSNSVNCSNYIKSTNIETIPEDDPKKKIEDQSIGNLLKQIDSLPKSSNTKQIEFALLQLLLDIKQILLDIKENQYRY